MEIQHSSAISNRMAKEEKYPRQPIHKRVNKFQTIQHNYANVQ